MCGIFALFHALNIPIPADVNWIDHFEDMHMRGPDETKCVFAHPMSKDTNGQLEGGNFSTERPREDIYSILGFHRLQIHGTSTIHGQPFLRSNWGGFHHIAVIANAEIYNYEALQSKYVTKDEPYVTKSDCEILLHMRKQMKSPNLLMKELSCELSTVIYTVDYSGNETIWVCRDPLGVRSLYWGYSKKNEQYYEHIYEKLCFASEMKGIPTYFEKIEMFPAGSTMVFYRSYGQRYWRRESQSIYYTPEWLTHMEPKNNGTVPEAWYQKTRSLLIAATKERLSSDRPIGCLLSGGLDSSLIASIVQREGKKLNPDFCVQTFSIGLPGSPDVKYARMVAEHIGSKHTEFTVHEDELLSYVEETIRSIESYCVTTVRASTANYLISKKIHETTDIAVLFCGDVSDEVFGSYRGCQLAPNDEAFFQANATLLLELPLYDLLRSDKSISANGLEARVPFADCAFVDHVMTAHPSWKRFGNNRMEKYILRKAFTLTEEEIEQGIQPFLPDAVLWRRKEAFSDGISKMERSWFEILQEYAEKQLMLKFPERTLKDYEFDEPLRRPYNAESLYYRLIFDWYYPGQYTFLEKQWRQPFTTILDPSARCLQSNLYNKEEMA
jgi:asparagine synthase (glutamine-hydrolysing)